VSDQLKFFAKLICDERNEMKDKNLSEQEIDNFVLNKINSFKLKMNKEIKNLLDLNMENKLISMQNYFNSSLLNISDEQWLQIEIKSKKFISLMEELHKEDQYFMNYSGLASAIKLRHSFPELCSFLKIIMDQFANASSMPNINKIRAIDVIKFADAETAGKDFQDYIENIK
jgi:hypothetical protein